MQLFIFIFVFSILLFIMFEPSLIPKKKYIGMKK